MTEPVTLVLIGAGGVLTVVALVAAAVAYIVHAHERREARQQATRHEEIRRDLDDFRRLVLRAIGGRDELETRVGQIEERVSALEGWRRARGVG